MYITWVYDLFPYELCGQVKEDKGNGMYKVEGYGEMVFRAKRIIKNDETGAHIKSTLEHATETYRAAKKELEKKHREYVAAVFAFTAGIKDNHPVS